MTDVSIFNYVIGGVVTVIAGGVVVLWRNHFAHRRDFEERMDLKLDALSAKLQEGKDDCLRALGDVRTGSSDARKELWKELNRIGGDVRVLVDFKKRTEH